MASAAAAAVGAALQNTLDALALASRGDRVDADAGVAEFDRERLGKADEPALGLGVGAAVGVAEPFPSDDMIMIAPASDPLR
jgi:hypothetical protein